MNPKLPIVLCALFLTACATHSVKDDSPANDLDVLLANVGKTTKPTLLPNGRMYCAELARTEDEQDACMGDLEDALHDANTRAVKTFQTVVNFAAREKLRRSPCGALRKLFTPARCRYTPR